MDSSNILTGLRVQTQIPLDVKQYSQNENTLSNLGVGNNLAYTYTQGLVVYCIEENTRWEWREVKIGEENTGLLNEDFIYPNGLISFGIDYSNKSFNFFPFLVEGNVGPEGPQGPQGIQGLQGIQGIQGIPGNNGTNGLNGADGQPGFSAYEVAVAEGFVGTELEWLQTLVGPEGPQGETGNLGLPGKNINIEDTVISVNIPEIVNENDTDRLLSVDDEGNIIRVGSTQNNFVRTLNVSYNKTNRNIKADVLDGINIGAVFPINFTIDETETYIIVAGPANVPSLEGYIAPEYKFQVTNLGKNSVGQTYGAGGIPLVANNLELIYYSPEIIPSSINRNPQIFTIEDLGELTISEFVNIANPSYDIQDQEDGIVYFDVGIAPNIVRYWFLGQGGLYGEFDGQTDDSDFLIKDVEPTILSAGQNITINENNEIGVDIPEIVDENDTARILAVDNDKKIIRKKLINDLMTGGVDDLLSAEQGKVLEGKIKAIENPNSVLTYGDIELEGLDVTILANQFEWQLNQVVFDNDLFEATIPAATDGFYRSDLLQVTNDNIIQIKAGVEDAVSSTVPSPDEGFLPIGSVNVFGAIIQNADVISIDFINLFGNGGATDELVVNKDAVNLIIHNATSLTGFTLSENLYYGKDFYIRNNTGNPLTLLSAVGTNNVRFFFDGNDLVIPVNNNAHFKLLGNGEFGGIGYMTFVGIIPELQSTEISIQNQNGFEQFKITDSIKFEGVSFSGIDKKIRIDPLVPLSAFLDPINGSDINGVLENANRPFRTIQALLSALPETIGETYNIYITGGTIPVTRRVPARNLNWFSYSTATLDFTNCMEDDGFTHAIKVQRFFSAGSFKYHFFNENISILCDYVGLKGWGYVAGTDASCIYITGTINILNWKSIGNSNGNGFALKELSDFKIIECYDSPQNTTVFGGGNIVTGSAKVKINTLRIGFGRVLSSGKKADITIDNIVKTGTNSFTFQVQCNNLSVGNIMLENCIFFPAVNNLNFYGTASANTNIQISNTLYISGKIASTQYVENQYLYPNVTQIFENFTGKLRNIKHTGADSARVLFKNTIITTDNTLLVKSGNTNNDIVTFEGYNSLLQVNTSSDLFKSEATSIDKTIEVQVNGTVTTNANSFGTHAKSIYQNSTFKEKLKEIVIRSKKDLVNRVLDSTTNYIVDGIITLLPDEFIEIPVGGLSLSGYGFDVSAIKATEAGSTLFKSPVGGCGNLFMANISLEASGVGSKVFDLTNAGAPTGGADAIELNVVNFDNCNSLGTLTNFRQGLWDNIGVFGCKDGLTLAGVWSGGFRSDLTIIRNFGIADTVSVLFKAGTDLLFKSRFWTDVNADFKTGGLLSNFITANFNALKLFQIKGAQLTRNGVLDKTQNYTDTIIVTDSVSDWAGNNGIQNGKIVIEDDIEINDSSKGTVFTSPDGSKWRATVNNLGEQTITLI